MTLPRLLLIDDEPALAAFVAKAADLCGFEPEIADQDQEFRESFRADRPKMVALDLGMPGMDGVELLRFLANESFEDPVLIISGFDRRVLDSAFRLIVSRRNIILLIMTVGLILGLPVMAYLLCAAWSVISTAIQLIRITQAFVLARRRPVTSWLY